MKKILSLILSLLLILSCSVVPCIFFVTASAATLTSNKNAGADDSGIEVISFIKGNQGGNPYTGGLNNPFGYRFTLDGNKKLLSINIVDFATYSTDVKKGSFILYRWADIYEATVASEPLYSQDIVNHHDHSDLVMTLPDDVKLNGTLYFEVIATEGNGMTPWSAPEGGADDLPGKVTGIQAYSGGNTAAPFACKIIIADMVNQSASSHCSFTYDFSDITDFGKSFGVNQTNQIIIDESDDYVTFTAKGDDPYFRFGDGYSPVGKPGELDYIVIKYRTAAQVPGGEIFSNHGGAVWGDPGTFVSFIYDTDGDWHTTVIDASQVWGNSGDTSLFAFRLDPLTGCVSGDSIDIAYLKFFGDETYAASFSEGENIKLDEIRESERLAGTVEIDFGTGVKPGSLSATGCEVFARDGFTRILAHSDASAVLGNIGTNSSFGYIQLVYRTEKSADKLTLTASDGYSTDTFEADVISDGFWHKISVKFITDGIKSLDIDCFSSDGDWLDIAYISFFTSDIYMSDYKYGKELNTHRYIFGQTVVDVPNVTSDIPGDPFCGGGESYGQKFTASSEVIGIRVYQHATWGVTVNEGYFKIWSWDTDYGTTIKTKPVFEKKLSNLPDSGDLTVTFDTLPAGEYLFEVKMTSPGDKAYTGFTSKGGNNANGVVSFRNGAVSSSALLAGYLTSGFGLVDKGAEYNMNQTHELDFSRRIEKPTEVFALSGFDGCFVTEPCDKGYITVETVSANNSFNIGLLPAVSAPLCDNIVVKYRTQLTGAIGKLTLNTADGSNSIEFELIGDGEWHHACVWFDDIKGNEIKSVILCPTGQVYGKIDISYIMFFANLDAAMEFYGNDTKILDGKFYAKTPLIPLDPEKIQPVLLLDGEKLNPVTATPADSAKYDYTDGFITYTVKGSDVGFYIFKESQKIAPFMTIRYRTSEKNTEGRIYTGSIQNTAHGKGDMCGIDYITDGMWHTAIINLSNIADYNKSTDGNRRCRTHNAEC